MKCKRVNPPQPHEHCAGPIPHHIRGMITSYFGGFKLQFTAAHFMQWKGLGKGIETSCIISPILFIMGMNLLITAAGKASRWPLMESSIHQLPIRGFMDDLTKTTPNKVPSEVVWFLSSVPKHVARLEKRIGECLRNKASSGLPGKFKAWFYRLGLLSRLMWLLMSYEVSMTSV